MPQHDSQPMCFHPPKGWQSHPLLRLGKEVASSALILISLLLAPAAKGDEAMARGEYLFQLAGCLECHTAKEGEPLAGGRPFETPYGTFYSPNITMDEESGIGRWSLADFRRALREGRSPDGLHYYPLFPYPSYSLMTDKDVADLWQYLRSQPAVAKPRRDHQLRDPFGWRQLLSGWKLLYFRQGPFRGDASQSAEWNRGAYIVRALAHCGECHTPRNLAGARRTEVELAGTRYGPDGESAPNITPDAATGAGHWRDIDFSVLLELGMMPDGDFVGAGMSDVVDNSTAYLTKADRDAVIQFLRSLRPIRHRVIKKKGLNGNKLAD